MSAVHYVLAGIEREANNRKKGKDLDDAYVLVVQLRGGGEITGAIVSSNTASGYFELAVEPPDGGVVPRRTFVIDEAVDTITPVWL